MNDNEKTKTELVMENVHLRRKLAETEARAERMEKRYKGQLAHNEGLEVSIRARKEQVKELKAEREELLKSNPSEAERRILDMWPRFEDGEPVWFGDAIDRSGRKFTVMDVKLVGDDGDHCDTFLYVESGDDVFVFSYKPGDRVKRPAPEVTDADGVLIRVGDTVYGIGRTGHEFKVLNLHDVDEELGDAFSVKCYDMDDDEKCHCRPELLTHREPDSWERLECDATMNPFSYCAMHGIETEVEDGEMEPTNEAFALDLIRRAKALAGIEVER